MNICKIEGDIDIYYGPGAREKFPKEQKNSIDKLESDTLDSILKIYKIWLDNTIDLDYGNHDGKMDKHFAYVNTIDGTLDSCFLVDYKEHGAYLDHEKKAIKKWLHWIYPDMVRNKFSGENITASDVYGFARVTVENIPGEDCWTMTIKVEVGETDKVAIYTLTPCACCHECK